MNPPGWLKSPPDLAHTPPSCERPLLLRLFRVVVKAISGFGFWSATLVLLLLTKETKWMRPVWSNGEKYRRKWLSCCSQWTAFRSVAEGLRRRPSISIKYLNSQFWSFNRQWQGHTSLDTRIRRKPEQVATENRQIGRSPNYQCLSTLSRQFWNASCLLMPRLVPRRWPGAAGSSCQLQPIVYNSQQIPLPPRQATQVKKG